MVDTVAPDVIQQIADALQVQEPPPELDLSPYKFTHLRVRRNALTLPGLDEQLVYGDIIALDLLAEKVAGMEVRLAPIEFLLNRIVENKNNDLQYEAGKMVKGDFKPVDLGADLNRDEDAEAETAKAARRKPRMFE